MSRFSDLLKHLREREKLSQEKFGQKVGVRQKSIWDWEHGKEPKIDSLGKIANYIGKTLEELLDYISEESSLTLEDFLANVSSPPRSSKFLQILELLPQLQAGELVEIARRCFDLLNSWFYRSSDLESAPSIAEMVNKLGDFSQYDQIPRDRLEAISAGNRPTDHDLVQLSLILQKQGGGFWTTHELIEIRDRSFPNSTCQTEEKLPNGNGV